MRDKVRRLLSRAVPASTSTNERDYEPVEKYCDSNLQLVNGNSQHATNGSLQHGNGSLHNANGSSQHANGSLHNGNGSLQHANGSLHTANGSLRRSNGSLEYSNSTLRNSTSSLGMQYTGEARRRTTSGRDCEYGADDFCNQGNGTCGKADGPLVWRGGGTPGGAGPLGTLTGSESSQGDKLEGTDSAPDDPIHLKRRVGLLSGVALIVGTMIGSGIFVSPSGLLVRTGSIWLSFVVWMACGLLSLLGALSYAELGTMNTSSGAEYAYFMDAFGAPPAFLFSWVSTLVLKPSQMAIICLSFAKYAVEAFVSECEPPTTVVKMVAVLAIVLILVVNCYSVNLATCVQNVFTAAKLVAILIVISGGMYKLAQGNTQNLHDTSFTGNEVTLGNVATAFYTGLWAYDGWNNLNYVTEEIKNPSKNLPRSIMIGIPLVTLCYALINLSYLAVMSAAEMVDSEAVAVTFGNRLLGAMAWLMPLSVTVSTFGSANGTLFAAGRLCFAASRKGHLLDILSYVHVRRFTPAPGLIFHSIIAMAMVMYGTIDSLIDFFSFTAWIFYGGSMLALIVMRKTKPHAPRPYKVPVVVPMLVLVISCYLVVAPILEKPQLEYLYASGFIFAGLLFYVPFVKMGYSLPFMGTITVFLQMMLEVVPTTTTFEY